MNEITMLTNADPLIRMALDEDIKIFRKTEAVPRYIQKL